MKKFLEKLKEFWIVLIPMFIVFVVGGIKLVIFTVGAIIIFMAIVLFINFKSNKKASILDEKVKEKFDVSTEFKQVYLKNLKDQGFLFNSLRLSSTKFFLRKSGEDGFELISKEGEKELDNLKITDWFWLDMCFLPDLLNDSEEESNETEN